MRLSFIHLRPFVADCKRLGLDDDAIRELELELIDRPESGKLIAGTGGLRKIRFSPTGWHRGKSGATRVCYAYIVRASHVYLVAAYGKNEKDNISAADKAVYRDLLKQIEQSIKR